MIPQWAINTSQQLCCLINFSRRKTKSRAQMTCKLNVWSISLLVSSNNATIELHRNHEEELETDSFHSAGLLNFYTVIYLISIENENSLKDD